MRHRSRPNSKASCCRISTTSGKNCYAKVLHPRSYGAVQGKSLGDRKEDALDSHANFQPRELFSINRSLSQCSDQLGSSAQRQHVMHVLRPPRHHNGIRALFVWIPSLSSALGSDSYAGSYFRRSFAIFIRCRSGGSGRSQRDEKVLVSYHSVLVSRKSFSVVFLQAGEHSADSFIQLPFLVFLCMVVVW